MMESLKENSGLFVDKRKSNAGQPLIVCGDKLVARHNFQRKKGLKVSYRREINGPKIVADSYRFRDKISGRMLRVFMTECHCGKKTERTEFVNR